MCRVSDQEHLFGSEFEADKDQQRDFLLTDQSDCEVDNIMLTNQNHY